MKQINTNKKVITNPRTGEESFVTFSNIRVTQSTSTDFVAVSMDISKRVDTEHIVVVEGTEQTIVNSKLEKLETITDTYDKQVVNTLVESKLQNKPEDIQGHFDTNNYLYINIAKDIIVNDSANYFNLTEADLEIV